MNNIDLKPEPKHPFVEMIVMNSDGAPINTFCGENAPLARILSTSAQFRQDTLIKQTDALMPLGQSIYLVDREYAKAYVRTFVDKPASDIEDTVKNMPETAKYYFVVSI
jgi:hypothetical protein